MRKWQNKSVHQLPDSLKAAFQKPTELKSDIDRALQVLKPTQKAIVIAVSISGFTPYEVGYWFDLNSLEIMNIEAFSVRAIKRFLNDGQIT